MERKTALGRRHITCKVTEVRGTEGIQGELQFSGLKTHTYVGSVAATNNAVVKNTECPGKKLGLGLGSVDS